MEEKLKEKYKIAKMRKVQLSQEYSKKPTKVLKEKDLDLIEAEFFKCSERYRRILLAIYNDISKKNLTTIQDDNTRDRLLSLKEGVFEQLNYFEVSNLFKQDVFFDNFCKEIKLTPKEIEICRAIYYDGLNEKQLREKFIVARSTQTNQLYSIKKKLSDFYNNEIEKKSILSRYLPKMELNEKEEFKGGIKSIKNFLTKIL